jgi:hypothetical protein
LLSKKVKIKVYKIIILRVVLYGCKTWSVKLRKEHTRNIFENRTLRKLFGPKMDETIGGWRKLTNVDLHNLYSSPNIIRMTNSKRMRWAGHAAYMGRILMHTGFW